MQTRSRGLSCLRGKAHLLPNTCIKFSLLLGPISFRKIDEAVCTIQFDQEGRRAMKIPRFHAFAVKIDVSWTNSTKKHVNIYHRNPAALLHKTTDVCTKQLDQEGRRAILTSKLV